MIVYGKLFKNGRSQAVRLPAEFRFQGDRVRVSRHGAAVLLEPVVSDADRWLATLDRFRDEPFMADGRRQPVSANRDGLP